MALSINRRDAKGHGIVPHGEEDVLPPSPAGVTLVMSIGFTVFGLNIHSYLNRMSLKGIKNPGVFAYNIG